MKTIKRIAVLLLLAVLLVPSLSSCRKKTSAVKPGTYCRLNDKSQTGMASGWDWFTITLNEDGTFSYFETSISSHIGMGNYTYENGIVTLVEESPRLGETVTEYHRFRYDGEKLIFLASRSDDFTYAHPTEGAEFDLCYRISYEGNTNDLFFSLEYPTTYWAKPGDAVEVRTEILCDADIVVEADGVPVEKSHYDSDYWGYSFIMPDHNVVVTLRAVSGWKS